jgi:hypothetical protein
MRARLIIGSLSFCRFSARQTSSTTAMSSFDRSAIQATCAQSRSRITSSFIRQRDRTLV